MADRPTPPPQSFSLMPHGVRSKLLYASLLMSAVPLVMLCLVAGWFVFPMVREFYHLDRWFPLITTPSTATWWVLSLIGLTFLISLLGSIYLALRIIDPIIRISHEAKQLVHEEMGQPPAPAARGDELSDLTSSLDQLTIRIRTNMEELKQFGERTAQMNLEIHERLLMLSGLLQIGELITQGAELTMILDLVTEKLALLDSEGFSFLCLQPSDDLPVTSHRTHGVDPQQLSAVAFCPTPSIIDAQHAPAPMMALLWRGLGQPNLIMQPLVIRNQPAGVLGIGSRRADYVWSSELIDFVAIFAKQASLALENELLLRKNKLLAVHDELTGAYNERYLKKQLAEEIKRAMTYRRPCAFALFAVQDLAEFRTRRGEPEADRVLKRIIRLVQESVTDIDRVARFEGDRIAVLLPERNKREALRVTQEVCQRVTAAFETTGTLEDRLKLLGEVAENPLDGATADELVKNASSALQWAMNQTGRPMDRPQQKDI